MLVKDRLLGVYVTDFTAGSLSRKGARCGTGNKVNSDKKLTEVRSMAECDRGEAGKKVASGGFR